jgi:hypothetical protein
VGVGLYTGVSLYAFNDCLAVPESKIAFPPLVNAPLCVLPVDPFTLSAYVTFEDSTNYAKQFGR